MGKSCPKFMSDNHHNKLCNFKELLLTRQHHKKKKVISWDKLLEGQMASEFTLALGSLRDLKDKSVITGYCQNLEIIQDDSGTCKPKGVL